MGRSLTRSPATNGLAGATALLASLALAGCASTGATGHVPVPRPFPIPGSDRPAPAPASGPTDAASKPPAAAPAGALSGGAFNTRALVSTALELRGTPYLDGGASPHGFDCSGFTQYVFARHGVPLPRAAREQFSEGKQVKPQDLAPGDLVFFTTTEPGASHVAIALGGDEFVHAPSSTGVVRVERLSAAYWWRRFIGARRVR